MHLHRREQEQKEWQERQAERKRRDAEMAGDPFHQQVNLICFFLYRVSVNERRIMRRSTCKGKACTSTHPHEEAQDPAEVLASSAACSHAVSGNKVGATCTCWYYQGSQACDSALDNAMHSSSS